LNLGEAAAAAACRARYIQLLSRLWGKRRRRRIKLELTNTHNMHEGRKEGRKEGRRAKTKALSFFHTIHQQPFSSD
jgi:hypothetical protein